MRRQLLVPFLLFLILFVSACRKETDFEVEFIPIEESLHVEIFSSEDINDSGKMILIQNAVIINSIEQLKNPFEAWDLDVPEFLEHFDYTKNTFLLRFGIEFRTITKVEHELVRNKTTGLYTYHLKPTVIVEFDNGVTVIPDNPEIYFFYTGILVPKIPDESEILLVTSNSWIEK